MENPVPNTLVFILILYGLMFDGQSSLSLDIMLILAYVFGETLFYRPICSSNHRVPLWVVVCCWCPLSSKFTAKTTWLSKATASYHLLNWSPISKLYLFPWDAGSGPMILRDIRENGWLELHFVNADVSSECFFFLGTRHRFLSSFLRSFSCTTNKIFHNSFSMFSQYQSDLR